MAITELVSVEEYLHSTFEHDAEYLEGRIVARSAPEKPHSKTQGYVCRTLHQVAHPLGYEVWVEQRIHTQPAPARYRVPDLCVTQGEPPEDIFTEPPFLCLEILSPAGTAVEVWAKIREYLAFGVAYVWIVDPNTGKGEIHSPDGTERVENGRFRAGEIEVHLGGDLIGFLPTVDPGIWRIPQAIPMLALQAACLGKGHSDHTGTPEARGSGVRPHNSRLAEGTGAQSRSRHQSCV